jgi:hypothetical protein
MVDGRFPDSRGEIQLLEDEMEAGHFGSAALLSSCIGICRAYRAERVVVINVRRQLRHLAVDGPDNADIDLFASLLMRHVRDPADHDLYRAAQAAWERIKSGG